MGNYQLEKCVQLYAGFFLNIIANGHFSNCKIQRNVKFPKYTFVLKRICSRTQICVIHKISKNSVIVKW